MMEWHDYISQLILRRNDLDDVKMSLNETEQNINVPPIIKASILMLDQMMEHQGKFNVMVFPERIQSLFVFTLMKLLFNISEGKIDSTYNPENFKPHEKLRLGKAVVEFLGVREENGEKRIALKLADVEYSAPMDFLPFFQKTNAQRLSKDKVFSEEKKKIKFKNKTMTTEEKYLQLLSDHKTHMDSSIVYMTSIINTKEMISKSELWGHSVKDIILVGQADFEGRVKNIGAGQLGGVPAIVLASDLYTIDAMVEQNHPIQSIIVDASNMNALLSQMDAMDRLMRIGVPITCVTDIVNSFDLQELQERGFNIWRWDETSITEELYGANKLAADMKSKYCVEHSVDYVVVKDDSINNAMKRLSYHKKDVQNSSNQMINIYDNLFNLAFSALWETLPPDENQCIKKLDLLKQCTRQLENEKKYISKDLYEDFNNVNSCLREIYDENNILAKNEKLKQLLLLTKSRRIALVVNDRCDKEKVESYWRNWCFKKNLLLDIKVFYPSEYYNVTCGHFDTTVVIGWLKRAVMRKILYSFNTKSYVVILYEYERNWRDYALVKWRRIFEGSQNRAIIEKSLKADNVSLLPKPLKAHKILIDYATETDEFAEIETSLRQSKYQQYVVNAARAATHESIEAIPVNYVGGYLAFYRAGHKVISASEIIEHDAEKIETKLPRELKPGDFVVVRETDHDIVKEMAELILKEDGHSSLRALSAKWKEALLIETLFYSPEEIYKKLQKVGCERGYQTVLSWITDAEMIAPQHKQDLEHIAKITGSGVLREKMDEIYQAAQTVKAAHIQAGKNLSSILKERVAKTLKEFGDIDPFNIWEPLEIHIDEVGIVRILKIIDIGVPVIVDIADTNRLIAG